jgi:hypothetical protein
LVATKTQYFEYRLFLFRLPESLSRRLDEASPACPFRRKAVATIDRIAAMREDEAVSLAVFVNVEPHDFARQSDT